MRQLNIIFIIALLLTSCKSEEYWKVDEFNLQPSALSDNQQIELVFVLTGTSEHNNFKYYNHIIAISKPNGDTINILTSNNNGFEEKDIGRTFNYFSPNNPASKISQIDIDDLDKVNLKKLDEVKNKKIDKVIRHKDTDKRILKFPTVFGAIGEYKPTN